MPAALPATWTERGRAPTATSSIRLRAGGGESIAGALVHHLLERERAVRVTPDAQRPAGEAARELLDEEGAAARLSSEGLRRSFARRLRRSPRAGSARSRRRRRCPGGRRRDREPPASSGHRLRISVRKGLVSDSSSRRVMMRSSGGALGGRTSSSNSEALSASPTARRPRRAPAAGAGRAVRAALAQGDEGTAAHLPRVGGGVIGHAVDGGHAPEGTGKRPPREGADVGRERLQGSVALEQAHEVLAEPNHRPRRRRLCRGPIPARKPGSAARPPLPTWTSPSRKCWMRRPTCPCLRPQGRASSTQRPWRGPFERVAEVRAGATRGPRAVPRPGPARWAAGLARPAGALCAQQRQDLGPAGSLLRDRGAGARCKARRDLPGTPWSAHSRGEGGSIRILRASTSAGDLITQGGSPTSTS